VAFEVHQVDVSRLLAGPVRVIKIRIVSHEAVTWLVHGGCGISSLTWQPGTGERVCFVLGE
jgi:hypothetical protein